MNHFMMDLQFIDWMIAAVNVNRTNMYLQDEMDHFKLNLEIHQVNLCPTAYNDIFYTTRIPLAGYNVLPTLMPADWNVVHGGQYQEILVLIVMLRMPLQSSSYDERKPLLRESKCFL